MTSVAPLALDTNILALYIVGLQKYEPDDFGLLIKILAVHDKFMVTPGGLAECSDLLRCDRPSAQKHALSSIRYCPLPTLCSKNISPHQT